MGINEIIMYIMMFFMLIAAVDRILSQFGGSARFLGKLGKSIEGSGGQFEEGFMAMGALGLGDGRDDRPGASAGSSAWSGDYSAV